MGLENPNPKVYVSTFQGQFTVKVSDDQKGQPGVKSRKKKDSEEVVYFKSYKEISGTVTGINKRVSEWNGGEIVSLEINLYDGKDYVLQLPWFSNLASRFFLTMENIDFKKKLKIQISTYNDRGYLFFEQSGQKVELYYTKENPKDKPDWVKTRVNGKEVWDRTDELEFFENIIETKIKPSLPNPALVADSGTITADSNLDEWDKLQDDGFPTADDERVYEDQEKESDVPF